jgi:hypothetical protein
MRKRILVEDRNLMARSERTLGDGRANAAGPDDQHEHRRGMLLAKTAAQRSRLR